MLVSDLLLAWLDPRIRFGGGQSTMTADTAASTSCRRATSPAPFDPYVAETLTPEQEQFYIASQWRLMWWRFRRHRLAVVVAMCILAAVATPRCS